MPCKLNKLMGISKLFLAILAAFAAGILGGLAAFSYLFGNPFISGNGLNFSPVRVTEKQVTTVQENNALKDAAAKVANVAIGVKVTGAGGAVAYGSGLILTSDGLVVVPYSLFPPGSNAEVTAGGKKATFEVVKRDKGSNLAILKLEASNWPTASLPATAAALLAYTGRVDPPITLRASCRKKFSHTVAGCKLPAIGALNGGKLC